VQHLKRLVARDYNARATSATTAPRLAESLRTRDSLKWSRLPPFEISFTAKVVAAPRLRRSRTQERCTMVENPRPGRPPGGNAATSSPEAKLARAASSWGDEAIRTSRSCLEDNAHTPSPSFSKRSQPPTSPTPPPPPPPHSVPSGATKVEAPVVGILLARFVPRLDSAWHNRVGGVVSP